MFTIYADDKIVYASNVYDDPDLMVKTPKCKVEIGKAGSLEFTISKAHYLYNSIKKLTTLIRAYYNHKEIFSGRVLTTSTDIYAEKTIHCEGNLTYLLDSVFPPMREKMSIEDFFIMCIATHNQQVEPAKRLTPSIVDHPKKDIEEVFDISGYQDTKSIMDDLLINQYGGYFKTRTGEDQTFIDYILEYKNPSNQEIVFGENILDFSEDLDATDIFTVLLPIGDIKQIEGSQDPNAFEIVTIAPVNNGSTMIDLQPGLDKYGRIVRTESFSGITDPQELLDKANQYIQDNFLEPPIKITISAIDLHFFDKTIDMFEVGQLVRVVSPQHNRDTILTVVSIDYNMINPENTTLTIETPKQRIGGNSFRSTSGKTISEATAASSGGKGGGSGGMALKYYHELENHAKIEAQKIELIGEDIRIQAGKIDQQGAQILINKNSITQEVTDRTNADNTLQGRINVEKDRITAEVTRSKGAEEQLSGRLTITESSITQEVTDRTNADNTLQGRINVEKDRITAEVTRSKGAEEQLSGRLTITESAITQEVTDRTNADNTLQGRINVEKDRITAEVTRSKGAEEQLSGRLTITESSITQEVTDRTNADNALQGRITVEKNRITAEVTRASTAEGQLSSRLDITEGNIELKVDKNGVINSINVSSEGVKIKAAKTDVTGIITAGSIVVQADLSAVNAKFNNLVAGVTTAGVLKANYLESTGNIKAGSNVTAGNAVNTSYLNVSSSAVVSGNLQVSGTLTGATINATTLKVGSIDVATRFGSIKTTLDANAVVLNGHSERLNTLESHNHDDKYAAKSHTHGNYSLTTHVHDSKYALKTHDHDADYAATSHAHGNYSLTTHVHDSKYAPKTHGHGWKAIEYVSNVTYTTTYVTGIKVVNGITVTKKTMTPYYSMT